MQSHALQKLVLPAAVALAPAAYAQATYTLTGIQFRAVSADGSRGVGIDENERPQTWRRGQGESSLSVPESSPRALSAAMGISWDGTKIVATLKGTSDSGRVQEAFLWTAQGRVNIGDLNGSGTPNAAESSISGNGAFAVGAGRSDEGLVAFRWSVTDGFEATGNPVNADFCQALAASYDGEVLVGFSGPTISAWRWSPNQGHRPLQTLGTFSIAYACSADGRTLVGTSGINLLPINLRAVVWNDEGELTQLPPLGTVPVTRATGISADGRVVVGNAQNGQGFIWDAHNGTRSLYSVALAQGAVGIPTYADALAISADGRTIVGMGHVVRLAPYCAGDVDDGTMSGGRDGASNADDLVAFLSWFPQGNPLADLDNGSGTGVPDAAVTIDDLIYFLQGFESGC